MSGSVDVTTPDELRLAIGARRRSLGLSLLDLDHVSGSQSGYCAKLLGPSAIKNFGEMSLGALLGALGSRLMVTQNGRPVDLHPIDALTLLRFPRLREAVGLHVALVHDDSAIPAVTRRLSRTRNHPLADAA